MTCSDPTNAVRYRALSVGPAASHALSLGGSALRVHSVFSSTMNLEVEGTDWIVALSGRPGGGYPHAVVLEDPEDFRDWRMAPGSRARLVNGSIHLQGQAGEVVVDLSQAQRLPPRPLPWFARIGGAQRACLSRLAEIQDSSGCDLRMEALVHAHRATTALGAELCGAALELGAATQAFARSSPSVFAEPAPPHHQGGPALESLRRAVAALIGLGAGLTPSGDDFLCGFLAAARGCDLGSLEAGDGLVARLNDAVEVNLGRTGSLSAFLLRCGIQNFWPGPLVDLAEALAGERENEALRALDELCLLGHSSGADLATGFLFGLETLLASPVRPTPAL